jgi:hypothetical protein
VLLRDDSLLPGIDGSADGTHVSVRSSRVAAACDTAATNQNDAVEWLTRVLRCALHGQGGDEAEG